MATELPTYTSVFRLRRRLYALYDFELPVPVGLAEVGIFLAAVAVFWALAQALGIGFTPGSAWFFLVPPGFVAYLARLPVADGKQPHALLASRVRYILEPRALHRLAEAREPSAVTLTPRTSHRAPAAAGATKAAKAEEGTTRGSA